MTSEAREGGVALPEGWRWSCVGLLFREIAPGVVTGLDRDTGVEYEQLLVYRPVRTPPPRQEPQRAEAGERGTG